MKAKENVSRDKRLLGSPYGNLKLDCITCTVPEFAVQVKVSGVNLMLPQTEKVFYPDV